MELIKNNIKNILRTYKELIKNPLEYYYVNTNRTYVTRCLLIHYDLNVSNAFEQFKEPSWTIDWIMDYNALWIFNEYYS